ncbi:unnamed protein product [Pedinophyceae sp. YPF-701]|nr:unnamed protein product [Pedinophyceae sp. YPF-701]
MRQTYQTGGPGAGLKRRVAAAGLPDIPVGAGFDPDGVFKSAPPPAEGLLERQGRRARERRLGPIKPLPAGFDATEGASPADEGFPREEFEALLASKFMPVDLDLPGIRVHHLDPAIITWSEFLSDSECEAVIRDAEESNTLERSLIGAAIFGTDSNAKHPALQTHKDLIHRRSRELLPGGGTWAAPGRLPPPGKYCFELLQVTRYEKGQQFMAHEDGFPQETMAQNGFQRRATVLAYLNDVPSDAGGATHFHELGVALRPARGTCAVFFPALAESGYNDERTLHAAEPVTAGSKWVAQQWVAWAPGVPAAAQGARGGQADGEADAALEALFGANSANVRAEMAGGAAQSAAGGAGAPPAARPAREAPAGTLDRLAGDLSSQSDAGFQKALEKSMKAREGRKARKGGAKGKKSAGGKKGFG